MVDVGPRVSAQVVNLFAHTCLGWLAKSDALTRDDTTVDRLEQFLDF